MSPALPPSGGEVSELETLRRENAYLRQRIDLVAAQLLRVDLLAGNLRHELEQKRRGFTLMGELAVTLGQDVDYENSFLAISRRINGALNMQRTVVLFPEGDGNFVATVLQGYDTAEREKVSGRRVTGAAEILDPLRPALVTGASGPDMLADLRRDLLLPYLIAAPVVLHGDVVAILVTGRLIEQRPFLPRLGHGDVETVQAVSAYLAAVLAGYRLRQAEMLANYDPLTGLPNLRMATEQVRRVVALARRGGFRAAMMFIDLDGFKDVNDSYGHAVGDAVLRIVAERLSASMREEDLVGRIGGDEFIVVLSHIARIEDAGTVAVKVLDELRKPIDVLGEVLCRVGASIGIAVFPDHGADESGLLRAADEAMYEVKKTGKNAFRYAQCGRGDSIP